MSSLIPKKRAKLKIDCPQFATHIVTLVVNSKACNTTPDGGDRIAQELLRLQRNKLLTALTRLQSHLQVFDASNTVLSREQGLTLIALLEGAPITLWQCEHQYEAQELLDGLYDDFAPHLK